MKKAMFCRIVLILLIFPQVTNLAFSQNLAQTWAQEKTRLNFVSPSENLLKDKHVIFVAGIMNELAQIISSYYSDNIAASRELGATTSYIAPPSNQSIPENAQMLYKKVIEARRKSGKKIILIGHSKGGAEIFYTILKHPELFTKDIIERVILIQPAIGGTPLVESGCEWSLALIPDTMKPNLKTLLPRVIKESFDSAFISFNQALLKEIKTSPTKTVKLVKQDISERVFYVRSQQSKNNLSLGVDIILGFCNSNLNNHGPNDGLLRVEDQFDKRLGKDLGILRSDHIGLTVSSVSNLTPLDRRSFTRALFKTVYPKMPQ